MPRKTENAQENHKKLKLPNDKITSNPGEILTAQMKYYINLYSRKHVTQIVADEVVCFARRSFYFRGMF